MPPVSMLGLPMSESLPARLRASADAARKDGYFGPALDLLEEAAAELERLSDVVDESRAYATHVPEVLGALMVYDAARLDVGKREEGVPKQ
jgi:hypothetical protein